MDPRVVETARRYGRPRVLGSILDDEPLEDAGLEAVVQGIGGAAQKAAEPIQDEPEPPKTMDREPPASMGQQARQTDVKQAEVAQRAGDGSANGKPSQEQKVSEYVRGLMAERDSALGALPDAQHRRATGQMMMTMAGMDPGARIDPAQERQSIVERYAKAIATGREKESDLELENRRLAQSQEGALAKLLQERQLAEAKAKAEFEAEERKRGHKVEDDEADRKFRARLAANENASRERAAALSAGAKADAAMKGTNVPGHEVVEGAQPTADDAKKVKASLASVAAMRKYVDRLRSLHDKYGTEYGGAVGTEMSQLMNQIQLEAKTVAELGALSGPDKKIMEDLSGADPSSFWANTKAVFGVDNTKAALTGLDQWGADRLESGLQTYGYRPKAGVTPGDISAARGKLQQAPPPGKVRIQLPDGSIKLIPESKKDEAVRSFKATVL